MNNKTVLIFGAGIGGPTLAFWLKAAGFEPTLIEHAPALRSGGFVIDFWGVGCDLAERMGLANDMPTPHPNFGDTDAQYQLGRPLEPTAKGVLIVSTRRTCTSRKHAFAVRLSKSPTPQHLISVAFEGLVSIIRLGPWFALAAGGIDGDNL